MAWIGTGLEVESSAISAFFFLLSSHIIYELTDLRERRKDVTK